MSQPRITDHPAVDMMKSLWLEGFRAVAINTWLEDEGYDPLNPQSLGKFGQTHWNEKVDLHWDDDPLPRIQEAIDQIEGDGNGSVTKATFVQKAYPAWKREEQGQDATSFDGKTTSISLSVIPTVRFPFERSPVTEVNLPFLPSESSAVPLEGWKTGVFLPDMQIGYRQDGDELVTTHDEVAIDLAHQLMSVVEAQDGLDMVVNAGDNLDLPAFSTHRSAPGYMQTTQFALDRASQEGAIQRALAPSAEIHWFQGNHEQRLTNSLVDRMPALVGLSRAESSDPVLSIPYLCRFDEYDINYIDPYPNGKLWANDHLLFLHGDKHSSAPGATARNQLAKGVSVCYGHIHRSELLYDRRPTRYGTTAIFAGSPGCLCKITGDVPSTRSGITAQGRQDTNNTENWTQGVWFFKYQTEGEQMTSLEPVTFEDGFTIFRGQPYYGKDRIDERDEQ